MDGLVNIVGRLTHLKVGGKTYHLTPMYLKEYAEREAYICSLKPSPLEAVEKLPPLPPIPKPVAKNPGEGQEAYNQRRAEHMAECRKLEALHAQRNKLIDRAFDKASRPMVSSFEDDLAFDNSLHGVAFMLWRAIRSNHPEFKSPADTLELIKAAGNEAFGEIAEAVKRSEESDLLKNSDGPDNGPQPTTETATESLSESVFPGGDFTPTLPPNTGGVSSTSAT